MIKNTETSYGLVAKGFHWLLFLMLTFAVIAGNFLAEMPKGAEKLQASGMHKSFGAIILLLVLARLLWRLVNVAPKEPVGISSSQTFMARAMHWLLYALMFAQPLSGILMSQYGGHPVNFFGLLEFPMLFEKNPTMAEFFRSAHGVIWIALAISVAGHIGAALYHHLIRKDDVLRSMTLGANA